MTCNWQTRESGCLEGYSLRDGKWKYQIVQRGIPSKIVYDLEVGQHYHHMRRTMDAENAEVIVWHVSLRRLYEHQDVLTKEQEITLRASLQAKAGGAPGQVMSYDEAGAEPLNADGTPVFEPIFDPWTDWSIFAKEWNSSQAAPDVESLSDSE